MKPVPPWTWMPSEATSAPISVEKALATGVSNAARSSAALRAAASRARWERSSATAVAKQMARAARVSARMVSSMRRTSTWAMIGTCGSAGVSPTSWAREGGQADREPGLVHHGEHGRHAAVFLADQITDAAAMIAVDHVAGRRSMHPELVLDAGGAQA